MKNVNIKVEFDPTPIRHMAIQCPNCEKWFHTGDIVTNTYPIYKHDICFLTKCKCPVCNTEFDLGNVEMDFDAEFPEFYDNCMQKKETVIWE